METAKLVQTNSLNQSIKNLNKSLNRSISFKYVFLRGIVNGLATAIGATIVAGLVIGILSRTIDSINDIPILGEFVDTTNLKEVIEEER